MKKRENENKRKGKKGEMTEKKKGDEGTHDPFDL